MSNYPNMSYCMVENTLGALNQVFDAMAEDPVEFLEDLSPSELRSLRELYQLAGHFIMMMEENDEEMGIA